MKVVDEGRMLPNGQAQGSSGLNNNPNKAEAEVREQSALDIVESVLRPSSLIYLSLVSIISITWQKKRVKVIVFTLSAMTQKMARRCLLE